MQRKTSRPDSISRLDRRRFCKLAASLVLPASAPAALGQSRQPPPFRTTQSQYTEFSPRPDVSGTVLVRADGRTTTIGAYRGKAILLPLWASWCPPCRRELPVFERLQALARRERFSVLPLALDTNPATAVSFVQKLGLARLVTFVDPEGAVASGPQSRRQAPFAIYGMPMAYIIDRQGRNAGYLVGEAPWDSGSALDLLRYYGQSDMA
jgi:thiol-disulfide isomerase/thioredoxin